MFELGGVTRIYLRIDGEERQWDISASPYMDTSKTLEEHTKRWRPGAEFIRAEYHDSRGWVFTYGVLPRGNDIPEAQ